MRKEREGQPENMLKEIIEMSILLDIGGSGWMVAVGESKMTPGSLPG